MFLCPRSFKAVIFVIFASLPCFGKLGGISARMWLLVSFKGCCDTVNMSPCVGKEYYDVSHTDAQTMPKSLGKTIFAFPKDCIMTQTGRASTLGWGGHLASILMWGGGGVRGRGMALSIVGNLTSQSDGTG